MAVGVGKIKRAYSSLHSLSPSLQTLLETKITQTLISPGKSSEGESTQPEIHQSEEVFLCCLNLSVLIIYLYVCLGIAYACKLAAYSIC